MKPCCPSFALPGGKEQDLPRLKGRFAFRLATTSYILPAPIVPNLKFLAPYLDEVELVLFQSGHEENLPSSREIRYMGDLAHDLDITYNVHLPTDVFLGDPDPKVRMGSVETLLRFHQRTLPLKPTLYVLHLETRCATGEKLLDGVAWAERINSSLEGLWKGGVDPSMVAVENLDYAPSWLWKTVGETGVHHCVDVGHMVRYGIPVEKELEQCLNRCSMVHLHGVADGVDHQGLDLLPESLWERLGSWLEGFQGGVSIEVFSLQHLKSSLERISQWVGEKIHPHQRGSHGR